MKNLDPPKTQSLSAKAVSSTSLTKRQLERQRKLEKKKEKLPEKQIPTEFPTILGETKVRRFAQGMGIRKIELNRETNSIEFDLEPDFDHVLKTICSWKNVDPETYLSQLLTEYFLSLKKQKLN